MYNQWIITLACITLILTSTGCMESQHSEERFSLMEQQHAELKDAFDTDQARNELSAMKIKNMEKSIQLIDERLKDMAKRLDKVSQSPERLAADLDSNKIYLKTVRDDLQTIRTETAESIRLQNQSIFQGRELYAIIMQREIETLNTRLTEMKNTFSELEAEGPKLQEQLDRSAAIIAGELDPNTVIERTMETLTTTDPNGGV